jgi:DNA-binding transcriptional ArsR family regulator
MSSGVSTSGQMASLRAMAQPLRLRLLSLLTGAAMSAAEVARELDLTHANASYHLRQLHAAGLLVVAEEQAIRGGRAKRYRYDLDENKGFGGDASSKRLWFQAMADELVRRAGFLRSDGPQASSDAELWVDPEAWRTFRDAVADASVDLHKAARPPRDAGSVHVSATIAAFVMGDER